MQLTYDRGIVDRIIESGGIPRGLPFHELEEPCVVQVVRYDWEPEPIYAVIFEGDEKPLAGEIVWVAE
jgi:hypothetical protein